MIYPFTSIPTKARADPLGPGTVNQLKTNTEALGWLLGVGHTLAGAHNVLEVPRSVGAAPYSAGYTLTEAANVASVATAATGEIDLTLDAAEFIDVVVLTNVRDAGAASKPHVVNHTFDGGVALKLYVKVLESALAGGLNTNTWGPADRSVDFAIFTPPVYDSAILEPMFQVPSGSTLVPGESYAQMRAITRNLATLRAGALVEHTAAGLHSTLAVAKAWTLVDNTSGTSYSVDTTHGVASIARSSIGNLVLTLTDTMKTTGQMFAFAQGVDGRRLIVHCVPASTTTVTCYVYEYDDTGGGSNNSWSRADGDFFFVLFAVPQ